MRLEIDIAEHHYNNIMAVDYVNLGRVSYKGIIMYAINAIKHGKVLEQAPTTKNDSKFCPDRKAKTTNMETILHCIENECVAYKDGKCLKYNSDQEPTTQERQAESDKFDAAFQEGYDQGYAQARFNYEQEPTTKNNLGVDYVSRQAIRGYIDYILSHGMGKKKSFGFIKKFVAKLPSVTPQLSSELEKNSKKLEKDFGESDCISRAQVQTEIEMNASRYTIARERGGMGQVEWSDQLIKVSDAVDIIRHLPSVTPQLSVPEVTALAEWTEKLTKASEEAYNKGYTDGVKSVNICPHCGEYIGEEE